jgi:hypothetical protein
MSSKLERDIEEVLAQIDRFPKRSLLSRLRGRIAGAFGAVGGALASIPRPRVNVGQVLLMAMIVIVVVYVFQDAFGSRSLVRFVIIGAIMTFIGAFVMSLRRHSTGRVPEKRWRGEPMDLGGGGESRPWWRRWRSRR